MKLSNLLPKKFDLYGVERKEREKIMNDLKGKVSDMSHKVLKNSLDQQQQWSRQNCILIHRIAEQRGEDKYEQALKIIREELGNSWKIWFRSKTKS